MKSQLYSSLEQEISQRIRQLYYAQLGHEPSKTSCQIFDSKLAILLEDSITQPERLLVTSGHSALVRQVRDSINEFLAARIRTIVEDVTGVEVTDILTGVQLETGHVSFIAVLAEPVAHEY